MRSVQPNGVAHKSHFVDWPESAIIRSMNMTPNTAMPKPVATRLVRPSWDVSAPTATKTAGAIVRLSPYSSVGPAPNPTSGLRPARSVIAVVPTNTMPTAANSAVSVATVARPARVPPARTSCQRPASSSPRSKRVAMSRPQTAPMAVRNTKHL